MREPMDIVTRISQRATDLRPAEQKVAQTVLGDIAGAAEGSIQTLAERAGVSEASVTRFAKAMGCRDVRELKLKLAQAAAVGQRFLDGGADRPPSSADGILADITHVLEANRALVRPEAFRAAAAALVGARMIAVFGMGGGSTTMADEMRYRLARLGRPVSTYHDAMLQRMVAATLGPEDVVVVFSVTGQVPEIIDGVNIAREYGAKVVAVTAIGSPVAALADIQLPIQAMETDFIFKPSSSRYAMMMMIDLLATDVALQQADRSKELLRRIKHVLDAHRGGGNRQPLGD
ncbi:MurR/RpiR family transcriptional regulator [Ralstonia nicotianae]